MDIEVLEGIFDANEKIARENEALFRERGVMAMNLMASPGAGKTPSSPPPCSCSKRSSR